MKILQVYNHFYPCVGGIEKYIEDLCIHLIKFGHTSDVCCLNTCANSKEKLKPHERYKGIDIYRIHYKDFKYYKIAPKVLNIVKKYDLIHVHGLGFFLDFLTSTKGFHKKPLILSTHGGIFHTKKLMSLKKLYFHFWSKHRLDNVDRVIAMSKNDEKLFSKISRPIMIPYAIKLKDFVGKRKEKNSFLFVGRLSKNKRVDRLLEIAFHLKKKIPDFKLYIVGDGNERPMLEKKHEKLRLNDNVYFVGEKTGKPLLEYYSKSKFFLSASEYEGFGISVIEAMASECIVIVNDIEAFRNFVKDGENGFISNFSNPKEASELILNIRNNDLSKISKNAKEKAKEYDWKNIIKRIEKIYMNLVE